MTRFRTIIRLTLTLLLTGIFFIPAFAAEDVSWTNDTMPAARDNTVISLPSKAYITPVSGGYMRVFFDGQKIGIEYFDSSMNLTEKGSLELELPYWGGFYAGSDGYYIAEGQSNTAENDSAEVIRIIRYDKNWKRTGAASITSNPSLFGGEVRYPFDYGCVNMAEYKGKLYLVTGHQGYVDEAVGMGHQGMLLVEVNKSSMTGQIIKCDLWHSFAQFIKAGTDGLYILEQSEGSRYTKLSKYVPETRSTPASFSVLDYGGTRDSAWAIPCYASVDGLELSQTHALAVGTSIDQSQYDNVNNDTPYNVYLTVTPFGSFNKDSTAVTWLTSYTGGGKSFRGVNITKVNDNKFMIAWEEDPDEEQSPADPEDTLSYGRISYLFVDGTGKPISQVYSADAPITDCVPITKDGKVVYYASSANMFNIYTIDPDSGAFSKSAMRVAGPNATWDIKDGVLTVSGTGPIEIVPKSKYSSANAWRSVSDSITKIKITGGITAIPDNAFERLSKLEEVVIDDGLASIGKEAFYGCDNLKSVYVPDSVTGIGDDFVWTGYYWTSDHSHVTRATVYANCTSYAVKYARENSIRYVSPHDFEDEFTIDSEPTCTEKGSKSRHCKLCGDKTDVTDIQANGHDYELGEITDNKAEASCRVCGDRRTVDLPVSVEVYWKNENSGSMYYYSYPNNLKPGEKMYVMIYPGFAGNDNQLSDFIVDTGVEQIKANGYADFSYSKPGAYQVKVYSRYLPEVCAEYTINVTDESGSVPANPDPDDQQGGGQTPADPGDDDQAHADPGSGQASDGQQSERGIPVINDQDSENTSAADRVNQTGADGTALGEGASAEAAEAAIAGMTGDNDLPGSVFGKLQLRSNKQTKTSIRLSWKKVSGAENYVIYGNKCGKNNKMQKLAVSEGKSATFSKVLGKKVKKGTYYKFMIIALDEQNNVVSSSKIIHVATKGGKVGNDKAVKTKAKKNKVTLKKGKTFKLKAKPVPASKKLKVKKHRPVKYETTDPEVAAVSGKGVISGKATGSCYVYAYAQNGTFAKIKVTVK